MQKGRGREAEVTGVRLIFLYKIVKAVLQVAAAVILLYGARHGLSASLARFADHLRHHAIHAWSNFVAAALLKFVHAKRSLAWTAFALMGDAVLSSVEGFALWRGYAWGEWLVVATSASLIPFEVYALTRHLRVGRVVLLLLNIVIVAYLLHRARHRAPVAAPAAA